MAETKKTSSAAGKGNAAKSGSGASSQKSGAKKKTRAAENVAPYDEYTPIYKNEQFWAIMLFAFALFLLMLSIFEGGPDTIWSKMREIRFGLLGFTAFLYPFALIYISVMLTYNKKKTTIFTGSLSLFVIILFISSLLFITRTDPPFEVWNDAKEQYKLFADSGIKSGSGFFGALIGGLLISIADSKAPAIVISLLTIFVFLMLATGTSLMKLFSAVGKPVKKVSDISAEKIVELKNRPKFDVDVDLGPPPSTESPFEDEPKEIPISGYPNVFDESYKKEKAPAPIIDIPLEKEPEPEPEPQPPKAKSVFDAEKEASIKEREENIFALEDEIAPNQDKPEKPYVLPPLNLLNPPSKSSASRSAAELKATGEKLINALKSFNVEASLLNIIPGPSVTRYEVAPAPGVKISRFTGLAEDLALHLAAPAGVRIEAPIPNKSAIGIEIPNSGRATVSFRSIIDSENYRKNKSLLKVALGKDIAGVPICADLAKMPHLLIAGTTGSGKSVALNAMIVSLLYNATPDEVRLLLIDPKQVEFSVYNGIPHLLVPVLSDARKAAGSLGWAVTEMIDRYKTLNDNGVRDIKAYNALCEENKELKRMPQIVIVIDELSDLMAVAPSSVEDSIMRLAQMARAAGIHLVVATQRPSVDVITGLIKANIPSRIALSVSSQVDSRTIIDSAGAEKLLGLGDMLFCPVGAPKPIRIQGCYLSDAEIERVVDFVKKQGECRYDEDVASEIERQAAQEKGKHSSSSDGETSLDEGTKDLIMKAVEFVVSNPEKASITNLQRRLGLGFAKAGRIMDELEERGIVGPPEGSKPRKVLITKAQWLEMNARQSDDAPTESHREETADII